MCIFGKIGYLWPAFCTSLFWISFFLKNQFVLWTDDPAKRLICLRHRERMGWEKVTSARPLNNNHFLRDEIYLGYSGAIPGKQLDHLASWPPQRQPWCSQKTSNPKLQTGFDKNNWPHLSLSPIQCLHHTLQHKHLRLKAKAVRFNKFYSSAMQGLTKLQLLISRDM